MTYEDLLAAVQNLPTTEKVRLLEDISAAVRRDLATTSTQPRRSYSVSGREKTSPRLTSKKRARKCGAISPVRTSNTLQPVPSHHANPLLQYPA